MHYLVLAKNQQVGAAGKAAGASKSIKNIQKQCEISTISIANWNYKSIKN